MPQTLDPPDAPARLTSNMTACSHIIIDLVGWHSSSTASARLTPPSGPSASIGSAVVPPYGTPVHPFNIQLRGTC